MALPPQGAGLPKLEHGGNVTILILTGGRARELEAALARERKCGRGVRENTHTPIDFTRVASLDSLGPRALIALHKRTQAGGGRLTLFNLSDEVYEVSAVTRLDTLVQICRESPPGERAGPGVAPPSQPLP